jgi:hypothetical protein
MLLGFASTKAEEAITVDLSKAELKPANGASTDLLKFDDGKISYYVNGSAILKIQVPADGEYTITLGASCDKALKKGALITLKADKDTLKENLEIPEESQKDYKVTAKLKKGDVSLSVIYTNDEYKENEYDRNFYLHSVKIEKAK